MTTQLDAPPEDSLSKSKPLPTSRALSIVGKRVTLSKQFLRYALGVVWLLDGLLQLQPYMFTTGFADHIIAPSASGQPGFVAAPVMWGARLILTHPVLFDALFASVQIALGVGFFISRAVRPVIVVSVAWAVAVWYLGEGLGGLAGAHVTALVGAPGAAIIYAVLAVAAWPARSRSPQKSTVLKGERPPHWTIWAWAILWVSYAIMSCLPGNVRPSDVSSQLVANASSAPAWLASLDRALAAAVKWGGAGGVVLFVAIELAIGLIAFSHSRFRVAAVCTGMALAGWFWAVGQSFGELFSGQATDPEAGPIVILLGLAVIGAMSRETKCGPASDQEGGRNLNGFEPAGWWRPKQSRLTLVEEAVRS
jgi:hypothetical protein